MGDIADDDRHRGMGIVVAYYTMLGKPGSPDAPDEHFEVTIVKRNFAVHDFNMVAGNGQALSRETMNPAYTV